MRGKGGGAVQSRESGDLGETEPQLGALGTQNSDGQWGCCPSRGLAGVWGEEEHVHQRPPLLHSCAPVPVSGSPIRAYPVPPHYLDPVNRALNLESSRPGSQSRSVPTCDMDSPVLNFPVW